MFTLSRIYIKVGVKTLEMVPLRFRYFINNPMNYNECGARVYFR